MIKIVIVINHVENNIKTVVECDNCFRYLKWTSNKINKEMSISKVLRQVQSSGWKIIGKRHLLCEKCVKKGVCDGNENNN